MDGTVLETQMPNDGIQVQSVGLSPPNTLSRPPSQPGLAKIAPAPNKPLPKVPPLKVPLNLVGVAAPPKQLQLAHPKPPLVPLGPVKTPTIAPLVHVAALPAPLFRSDTSTRSNSEGQLSPTQTKPLSSTSEPVSPVSNTLKNGNSQLHMGDSVPPLPSLPPLASKTRHESERPINRIPKGPHGYGDVSTISVRSSRQAIPSIADSSIFERPPPTVSPRAASQQATVLDVDQVILALSSADVGSSILDSLSFNLTNSSWRDSFIASDGIMLLCAVLEIFIEERDRDAERRIKGIDSVISSFIQLLSDPHTAEILEQTPMVCDHLSRASVDLCHSNPVPATERAFSLMNSMISKLKNGIDFIASAIRRAGNKVENAPTGSSAGSLPPSPAQTPRNNGRMFEWLLREVATVPINTANIPYFKSVVNLINSITTGTDSLEGRLHIRQQLQRVKLLPVLQHPTLQSAPEMRSCLRVYFDGMTDDFEELLSITGKDRLGKYFNERRADFGHADTGNLVVIAAPTFSTVLVVGPYKSEVTPIEVVRHEVFLALGLDNTSGRYGLFLPFLSSRKRSSSTPMSPEKSISSSHINSATKVETRGDILCSRTPSMPLKPLVPDVQPATQVQNQIQRKKRPRSKSNRTDKTRGWWVDQNEPLSAYAKSDNSAILLELKLAPWNLSVEFVPPPHISGAQPGSTESQRRHKEISIDPNSKCGDLPPQLLNSFGIKGQQQYQVDYDIYFRFLEPDVAAHEWPRSGREGLGVEDSSSTIISLDERIGFFSPSDLLSKYHLDNHKGVLVLRPKYLSVQVQVMTEDKTIPLRILCDSLQSVAQFRERVCSLVRVSSAAAADSVISAKVFLHRSRSIGPVVTDSTMFQETSKAIPMDFHSSLESYHLDSHSTVQIISLKRTLWIMMANIGKPGLQKSQRTVDITVPFSEVLLHGGLFAGAENPIATGAIPIEELHILLRRGRNVHKVDPAVALAEFRITHNDMIIIEKRGSSVPSTPRGNNNSLRTPRSSREFSGQARPALVSLWDTIKDHETRGYVTLLYDEENNSNTPVGPSLRPAISSPMLSPPADLKRVQAQLPPPVATAAQKRPPLRSKKSLPDLGTSFTSQKRIIRAATLEQIVLTLTTPETQEADPQIVEALLALLSTYTSVEVFVNKLFERFDTSDRIAPAGQLPMKTAVIALLKIWVEKFYFVSNLDFQYDCIHWLVSEIEKDQQVQSQLLGPLNQLRDLLEQKYSPPSPMSNPSEAGHMIRRKSSRRLLSPRRSPPCSPRMAPPSELMRELSSPVDHSKVPELEIPPLSRLFMEALKPADIARELTLFCSHHLSQLKVSDIFDSSSWSSGSLKKAEGKLSFNSFETLIGTFNRVADWTSSAIVSEPTCNGRVKLLTRFIKLARSLRKLNNYHLVMAVISGLNESSVSRLKWTWAKISRSDRSSLKELEDLMNIQGSWKNYRSSLARCIANGKDYIPSIVVACHDITFMEEGNQDFIPAPKKSISESSRSPLAPITENNGESDANTVNQKRLMYQLSHALSPRGGGGGSMFDSRTFAIENEVELLNVYKKRLQYQLVQSLIPTLSNPTDTNGFPRVLYPELTSHEAAASFLTHLPGLPEERMYELSLIREPRNIAPEDVV